MSALIDDNDVTLTDFQLEAMEELRQIINNGTFSSDGLT